jgi:hypothetical protein
MKFSLLIISAILSTQIFVNAGTVSKSVNPPVTASEELFRAGEIQVDAYFAGVAESDGFLPGWGGGAGLNYYLTRYIGLGIEQDVFGKKGGSLAHWGTSAHLFLRYPIESLRLAPYAVVGGGTCYASGLTGHGSGDMGGGVEYRFNRNLGLFSEARYFYSAELPRNSVIYRTGFRFVF